MRNNSVNLYMYFIWKEISIEIQSRNWLYKLYILLTYKLIIPSKLCALRGGHFPTTSYAVNAPHLRVWLARWRWPFCHMTCILFKVTSILCIISIKRCSMSWNFADHLGKWCKNITKISSKWLIVIMGICRQHTAMSLKDSISYNRMP